MGNFLTASQVISWGELGEKTQKFGN